MEEEKKENEAAISHKKFNLTEKIRENPWILSTFVCCVLVLVLLVTTFSGSFTGNVISEKLVGEKFINFLQEQGADVSSLNITDISLKGDFYEISFDYKGEPYPVSYSMTKDGKYIGVMNEIKTSSSPDTQTTEVPKTQKPKVELFVMSYCPYGTQMEKAIIPAINLLKDKIDFTLRFVSYAMHGQKEIDENTRQYCIQKEQNDKFTDYLSCFLQAGDSASCLTSARINQNKLNSCILSANAEFSITDNADAIVASGDYPPYNIDKTLTEQYGVQGSPTLIINGVTVQATRSPEGVKGAICNAFSNVPSECSQTLSTNQASAGFGTGTSSSSSGSC
jgi:hypothetical protein